MQGFQGVTFIWTQTHRDFEIYISVLLKCFFTYMEEDHSEIDSAVKKIRFLLVNSSIEHRFFNPDLTVYVIVSSWWSTEACVNTY